MKKTSSGFTIVELLIVIVVYSGIQDRARGSKIRSDVAQLAKAMTAAKTLTGKTIVELTSTTTIGANNTGTGRNCWSKASDTDLAAVAKTDKCWKDYYETLQILSDSSGINVVGMTDPYNRPYFIDQSEGENVSGNYCIVDKVGTYKNPFVTGSAQYDPVYTLNIANITPGC